MYKLIAIDLDGTMLNSYGLITENTKKILLKAKSKGIEIVIASGRNVNSIKNISQELNCINYFIAGNGAILYDMKKDETLYEKNLNKEKVLEIIKICEENSIFYSVYTKKEIITKSLKYNILYYYKENYKKEEEKKTKINVVPDIYEYVKENYDIGYMKIMICDESKIIFDSILRRIRELKDIEVLDVEHMSRKLIKEGTEEFELQYYYTEISSQNVDKWYALNKLIQNLQIFPEEVIAIGDNINDQKMIENAGLGIAMGQSTPVIKENSDYVTDDNNSEGVANAIEKLLD